MTTLTPHQEEAVKRFTEWYHNNRQGHFYLGGYAGTGKSTILPPIVESTGLDLNAIAFCAPTGKAAKVMSTKMKASGLDVMATTIHKLIYTPMDTKIAALEAQITDVVDELMTLDEERKHVGLSEAKQAHMNAKIKDLNRLRTELDDAMVNRSGPQFVLRSAADLLTTKSLIIVDEASMVGTKMADDLKGFGIPVLAIGDPGQLPPVQDDPGLTYGKPDAFLHEIHRQAVDNPIIWLSKQVREGKPLNVGKHGDNVRIITRKNDTYTTDTQRDQQVIVGRNNTRWRITDKIREAWGYESSGPQQGEPLIVCKNSKTFPNLVNGSFVECEKDTGELKPGEAMFPIRIRDEENQLRSLQAFQPLFEEHRMKVKGKPTAQPRDVYRASANADHFDFGWAITCHKSQGSQWDNVVVHDEAAAFREDWSRWLYTAVTRAANDLTVVQVA